MLQEYADARLNATKETMPIGLLLGGMSVDFEDVLLIINAFAIVILLGVLYVEKIVAGTNRLMKALNPLTVLTRFRLWRTVHKVLH